MGGRVRERGVVSVFFLGVLAIVGIAFAVTLFLDSQVVLPRHAHAYGGYGPRGRKNYVKACKGTCKNAKRTCMFCAEQDLNEGREACKGQRTAETGACVAGDRACAKRAKSAFRECKREKKRAFKLAKKDCKQRNGGCNGCCRADYNGQCWGGQFKGTKGYGTFFRRYCTNYYGKKSCRTYKPDCSSTGYLVSPGVGEKGLNPR